MPPTTSAPPRAELPPFAAQFVLPIAAAVAAGQLIAAFGSGYWFDEVYMLAIGRNHLDWGSADQPPLTPLLAALMDTIAPGSVPVLRIPAILATTAAVAVAALIAREIGGDRRAQAITAGVQATALWITLAGHWLTPYTLEPVQWLVLLWLLVRWVRTRDDRSLLALGAVAGIAAETKFQVLLLCAVLLLSVLLVGPRELLARPALWGGAAIGAGIAAPTLWWQAVHDWPQLRMGGVVVAEADALYGGRPGVATALIILAGIAGTALLAIGVWALLRDPRWRSYRFLIPTLLLLYALFVLAPGRPYYLGGFYAVVAAFGAVHLQQRRVAGSRRLSWVVWPAFALSAAAAVGMLTVPAAEQSAAMGEDVARNTANAYRSLPAEQQQRTAIIGGSYINAAYVDGYSTQLGLPEAHSTNRSYGYFDPPPPDADSALYVGRDPAGLRPYFTGIRPVHRQDGPSDVWLLTGRTAPWEQIWAERRALDVG